MARYWIADLHLGHEKVAKIRGFDSVAEHDSVIVKQLSGLVTGDQVWVLGDISSGKPEDEDYALATLGNIHLHIGVDFHLIAGNHDSVSSIHRNGYKKQHEWFEAFESIQQFGRIKLNGHHVLMSHYPYARSGDGPGRGEGRYNEFRLPDVGAPLIHGHTHHTEPHMTRTSIKSTEVTPAGLMADVETVEDTQQFCVSWDVKRGLVTEHDLNQWLEAL